MTDAKTGRRPIVYVLAGVLVLLAVLLGRLLWSYIVPTKPVNADQVTDILLEDGNTVNGPQRSLKDTGELERMAELLGQLKLKKAFFSDNRWTNCGVESWTITVRMGTRSVTLLLNANGEAGMDGHRYEVLEGRDQARQAAELCRGLIAS